MSTPDETPQCEPSLSFERARFFVVSSWVLRVAWFCTVWTFVWLGWGLFAISAWLDSFVGRPRPKFTFRKAEVSNWILLGAFAIGVAGMWLFHDYEWVFLAFGVVASLIILFEAFHYARADVGYLCALRDVEQAEEPEPLAEGEKPQDEQLPLL